MREKIVDYVSGALVRDVQPFPKGSPLFADNLAAIIPRANEALDLGDRPTERFAGVVGDFVIARTTPNSVGAITTEILIDEVAHNAGNAVTGDEIAADDAAPDDVGAHLGIIQSVIIDLQERAALIKAPLAAILRWPRYGRNDVDTKARLKFAQDAITAINKADRDLTAILSQLDALGDGADDETLDRTRDTLGEIADRIAANENRLSAYFNGLGPELIQTLVENGINRSTRVATIAETAVAVTASVNIDDPELASALDVMKADMAALVLARNNGASDEDLLDLEQALYLSSSEVIDRSILVLNRLVLEPSSHGETEIEILIAQLQLLSGSGATNSAAPLWAQVLELQPNELSLIGYYLRLQDLAVTDILDEDEALGDAETPYASDDDDDEDDYNYLLSVFYKDSYINSLNNIISYNVGLSVFLTSNATDATFEQDERARQIIMQETVRTDTNRESFVRSVISDHKQRD